ncbi:PSP1 domain-containing protein [Sediminibacterium ginsengisoli]|uniref:Cell fate regulator YaaT, PSP1 superfamily (Controls sporulation, competence, biofilm development) n=1 Tax=Sediminibacterium ginsengisoli TaxID=413434 RepID=A0A1T4JTY2_9BACT|nr:regulatory iron-sulfur-containing complex subunit RicT [Sediminibacterium ginsengisoli]SJZ33565.1 Cell fate regulator YaaT, PSP1 superfamily (controls sporulation, competence, biofilm development) [Sediminibacterium ginsengisoli]
MGCGSCGTATGGKPGGCKSNGGCSTGGCNRLNVHDWLMNLPFSDPESSCKVVEVSFKQGSRKEFFRNPTLQFFEKGEYVTVEGVSGFDVGEVSLTGELVRIQMKKKGVDEFNPEMKKILRRSSERDVETFKISKGREKEILARSRAIARQLGLQMKLSEVEIQADGKKGTFFYTADDRVDFREMIKIFAGDFKVKVEMRQIGIRQEAAKVGGIGSCGRELCCSTWLNDFKSVNTTAARYQNLSINQTKLSGQCGRLKCCLNYELDTYLDALQHFPDYADTLDTVMGTAQLIKKDIFKNLMWYVLPNNNKHYPLTIQRVKEIKRLNQQGQRVDELQAVEITSGKQKEAEPAFVELVGQISLKSLERNDRRRRDQQRNSNKGNNQPRQQQPRGQQEQRQGQPGGSNNQQGGRQQNRPQQQGGPKQQQGNRPAQPPKNNPGNQEQKPSAQAGNRPQQNPNRNNQQGGAKPQGNRPPRPPRPQQGPPPPPKENN